MNVPIRMVGIATTVFWVFLIIFAVSAAFSVKDLQFSFGEAQMTATPDYDVVFTLPINVVNKGYYNIGLFNVTTEISSPDGSTITRGSTLIRVVRKGSGATVFHNITLDVDDLLQSNQSYLFNDTELNIAASVGMRIAEVIPVQASTNFSVPWGAPLYNFKLGEPKYVQSNLTHLQVNVPISFENHAPFDVVGSIQAQMHNNADLLAGIGGVEFSAAPRSLYNSEIEFQVNMASVAPSGYFEIRLASRFFNYGPLVIPYG